MPAETHDPTPSGRIVYLPPGGAHSCPRPDWSLLDLPPGTIWRCSCDQSWTVDHGSRARYWRHATVTERLKAKLMSHRADG